MFKFEIRVNEEIGMQTLELYNDSNIEDSVQRFVLKHGI